jgi:uncharacterized membrane protein
MGESVSPSEPSVGLLATLGIINLALLCATVGVDLWILDVRDRIAYSFILLTIACVIGTARRVHTQPRTLGWPRGTQLVLLAGVAFVALMIASLPNGHSVIDTLLVGALLSLACAAAYGVVARMLTMPSAT